jgi:hypothetical protein
MLYQRSGPLHSSPPAETGGAYEPDPVAWEERARQDMAALGGKA